MRRPSYLARIVEDVTTRKRQPVLNPPRLLFRPSPVSFDLGLEVESEPARARAGAQPKATADATRVEGDGWTPESPNGLRRSARSLWPDPGNRATAITAGLPIRGHNSDVPPQPPPQPRVAERSRETRPGVTRAIPATEHQATTRAHANVAEASRRERAEAVHAAHNASALKVPERPQSVPPQRRDPWPVRDKTRFAEASVRSSDNPHKPIAPPERRPGAAPVPKAEPATRIALLPPKAPPVVAPKKEPKTRGAQVNIGTLEVRIIPPGPAPRERIAPPVPAPRTATPAQPMVPLARGFGVFGLRQS